MGSRLSPRRQLSRPKTSGSTNSLDRRPRESRQITREPCTWFARACYFCLVNIGPALFGLAEPTEWCGCPLSWWAGPVVFVAPVGFAPVSALPAPSWGQNNDGAAEKTCAESLRAAARRYLTRLLAGAVLQSPASRRHSSGRGRLANKTNKGALDSSEPLFLLGFLWAACRQIGSPSRLLSRLARLARSPSSPCSPLRRAKTRWPKMERFGRKSEP